ncbi:hypothetical protein NQ317_009018 [Molorchus minor]|uniref:Uncharacterized protein n=1 Tax=Molorchus minor TaxID=1323400 RepID=A0ABQ9JKY7_9CUCU|nr:hypothetical protein NQ317_009018 [Molorchus minor]
MLRKDGAIVWFYLRSLFMIPIHNTWKTGETENMETVFLFEIKAKIKIMSKAKKEMKQKTSYEQYKKK